MARSWKELFITDGAEPRPAGEEPQVPRAGSQSGRFRRLRDNLRRTRQALTSEIQATSHQVDAFQSESDQA